MFSKSSFQNQSALQSSCNACCSAVSRADAMEIIACGTKAFCRGTISKANEAVDSFSDSEIGDLPGASFDNMFARAVENKTSCPGWLNRMSWILEFDSRPSITSTGLADKGRLSATGKSTGAGSRVPAGRDRSKTMGAGAGFG